LLTEHEIESKWEIAKLLITTPMSYKILLYTLPQYGLYLQSLRPIRTVFKPEPKAGPRIFFRDPKFAHIAAVRTENIENVVDFIQEQKRFQAMRIFKHGRHYKTLESGRYMGLVCNTVKNMMALKSGSVFRITSQDKKMRDVFYATAIRINEEDNLGCSFDYDEYDYTLEIRKYNRYWNNELDSYCIVTILYGDDLPNHYNM